LHATSPNGTLTTLAEGDGPEAAVKGEGVEVGAGSSWIVTFTNSMAIGTLQHGADQWLTAKEVADAVKLMIVCLELVIMN
jgi:hypothetical protein